MRDRGGSVTMGPRFSEIYSLLFTYSYADRLRFDVENDTFTRQQVLGNDCAANPSCIEFKAVNSNITTQLIRDTRDNQFDPTRGMRTSMAITEGGFFRPTPSDSTNRYWTTAFMSRPFGNSSCRSMARGPP